MKEIWRPVPVKEYADLYEVSNLGRVRSSERTALRSRVHGTSHQFETHVLHVKSRILKPYIVTKKRGIKYHLHARIKSGYCGQSDAYFYARDLVKGAFPKKKNIVIDGE